MFAPRVAHSTVDESIHKSAADMPESSCNDEVTGFMRSTDML